MAQPWVWTGQAMQVAGWVLKQLPAIIADRAWVRVCPTGAVDLQFSHNLPLTERISYVEQVAAVIGAVPTWREPGTGVESWFYTTNVADVNGIGVSVYTSADAEELIPTPPELAEVSG